MLSTHNVLPQYSVAVIHCATGNRNVRLVACQIKRFTNEACHGIRVHTSHEHAFWHVRVCLHVCRTQARVLTEEFITFLMRHIDSYYSLTQLAMFPRQVLCLPQLTELTCSIPPLYPIVCRVVFSQLVADFLFPFYLAC